MPARSVGFRFLGLAEQLAVLVVSGMCCCGVRAWSSG